jgi:hypothetical protein
LLQRLHHTNCRHRTNNRLFEKNFDKHCAGKAKPHGEISPRPLRYQLPPFYEKAYREPWPLRDPVVHVLYKPPSCDRNEKKIRKLAAMIGSHSIAPRIVWLATMRHATWHFRRFLRSSNKAAENHQNSRHKSPPPGLLTIDSLSFGFSQTRR